MKGIALEKYILEIEKLINEPIKNVFFYYYY